MFRLPRDWVICSALLLSAASGVAADEPTIFRCESARGGVSYSNTPCPAGSRAARTVEREPAVEVPDASGKPESAKAPSGKIAPAKKETFDPWLENQRLNEQIAQQRRACAELDRSITFYQRDLNAAAPGHAASIELELRRAQDDYRLHCAQR